MTPALFAEAVLSSLSLPVSENNIAALVAIQRQEGGHEHNSAAFNPLNTGYDVKSDGHSRSAGLQVQSIKAYDSWDEGIRATAKTIAQPSMRGIYDALAKSLPPEDTLAAFAASPWGWYKYEKGVRIPLPYPLALATLRNHEDLVRYANAAYRGAQGFAGAFWRPGSFFFGDVLPLWAGLFFSGATAVLGSQLAGKHPRVGAAIGAGVGLGGWYWIRRSLRS